MYHLELTPESFEIEIYILSHPFVLNLTHEHFNLTLVFVFKFITVEVIWYHFIILIIMKLRINENAEHVSFVCLFCRREVFKSVVE
jgi:hypothetical protein